MGYFDIGIIAVICVFFLFGFWKGFVKAGISLATTMGGLALVYLFADKLAGAIGGISFVESLLSQYGTSIQHYVTLGIAAVVIFIGTWLVGFILKLVLHKALKRTHLSIVNRLLGGILYVGISVIVISLVMSLFNAMSGIPFMENVNSMIASGKISSWFSQNNIVQIIFDALVRAKG